MLLLICARTEDAETGRSFQFTACIRKKILGENINKGKQKKLTTWKTIDDIFTSSLRARKGRRNPLLVLTRVHTVSTAWNSRADAHEHGGHV
jgi:hypothetical protein